MDRCHTTKGRNAMKSLAIVTGLGLCAFATDAVAQPTLPVEMGRRRRTRLG